MSNNCRRKYFQNKNLSDGVYKIYNEIQEYNTATTGH
jgi:hypothetical protein